MATVSLCMIVKDEENTLQRCLNSVQALTDEIIIVDTGSTDRTEEIAAHFTDKIYEFPWTSDFSAARNFSYEKATMDYILWLDADDIVLPQDSVKFQALKRGLSSDVDAVMMQYHTAFDNQGNVLFSYPRERLVKRVRGYRWSEPVHEFLEISGTVIRSDICITHAKPTQNKSSDRNLEIYRHWLTGGNVLSPRGMYYLARELGDHGKLEEAASLFQKFLNSQKGWVEDNITACGELAKCYQQKGDDSSVLPALFRSFSYDTPRAEICCQIGYYFKLHEDYRQAAFWFNLCLNLKKPESPRGFFQKDCWGYIPSIECAVCWDYLADYTKAEYYNHLAANYKSDAFPVLLNSRYFNERKMAQRHSELGGQTDVDAGISRHQS
jgi:glycosyltransferase involved in cell wall biosynthesis